MSEDSSQHPVKEVALIGTHHTYQYGVGSSYSGGCTADDEVAFRKLVRSSAVSLGVNALAEELNEDGLKQFGVKRSVLQQEAALLDLQHCFCEPGLAERDSLGVQDVNLLKSKAWLGNWPDAQLEQVIRNEFWKRETFWLERIEHFNCWPLLFVCGADHVGTFPALLRQHGVLVTVLETCWEAGP